MQAYELDGQARPRECRRTTYFCRLCREYGVVNRKAHLKNRHNASHDTINKRSSADLVSTIFIESASSGSTSY